MSEESSAKKIAFVGNHLRRKRGIATFTADLLSAVADAHPRIECFAAAVNDTSPGYDYRGLNFELHAKSTIGT